MQSKLMTEKQYQEISQLESVPQVVAYLKKQPGSKNCGPTWMKTPFTG